MRRFQALLIAAGLAAAPASAVAGPSPTNSSTAQTFEWSMSKGRLGVMVMTLTPELRQHFGTPRDRGVLVARVDPGTPAATAGIEVGDIIVQARGKSIDGATALLSALADVRKGQTVTLEIVRDARSRFVQARLTDDPLPTSFDERWFDDDWLRPFHDLLHPTRPIETSLRS